MILCPNCNLNEAEKHPFFGFIYCKKCRDAQATKAKPSNQPEFFPEYIKEDRQRNKRDLEPQHIKGYLNKKWVEQWGVKRAKELGYSDKEIKNSKYVYSGEEAAYSYYKEGN